MQIYSKCKTAIASFNNLTFLFFVSFQAQHEQPLSARHSLLTQTKPNNEATQGK